MIPIQVTKIISGVTKFCYKTGIAQKAPQILLGTGITAIIGGTVFACKETLNMVDICGEFSEEREAIEKLDDNFRNDICPEDEDLHYEGKNKDIFTLYLRTTGKIVKNYMLPASFIFLGIALILTSHGLIRAKYLSAVAAYNATLESFKNYRRRVIQEYGPDTDKDFMYGVHESSKIEEIISGKKKENREVIDQEFYPDDGVSPYMVVWGSNSTSYIKPSNANTPSGRVNRIAAIECNKTFLIQVEESLTKRLRTEGYLFLNDARRAIGLPPLGKIHYKGKIIKAGSIGWVYPVDEHGTYIGPGDGEVNFGIRDFAPHGSEDTVIRNRINCDDATILIDFNVDGDISDYLLEMNNSRDRKFFDSFRRKQPYYSNY